MNRTAILITGLCCVFLPAIPQQAPVAARKFLTVATLTSPRPVVVAAATITRLRPYPSQITLLGKVEIKTPFCFPAGDGGKQVCDGWMILRADEATLHEDTGQIEARGNVNVIPLEHEAPK